MASILNGKWVATEIKNKLKQTIQNKIQQGYRKPGLAVVLIGNDEASSVYVKNKKEASSSVGIESHAYHLSETTEESELLALIETLNKNTDIDGILVQLPLPAHMDSEEVIEAILPQKDVDGFHPYNIGRLALKHPTIRPCTPMGIMSLLEAYQISVEGLNACVVGASNIVGRPMALELLLAGATPTICHSKTKNLEAIIRQADLIVVAAGKQDLIQAEWLNNKQILIDVGIHRLSSGKLRGDICFDAAEKRVAYITPVPGGIGPMTVASLLQNTVSVWLKNLG